MARRQQARRRSTTKSSKAAGLGQDQDQVQLSGINHGVVGVAGRWTKSGGVEPLRTGVGAGQLFSWPGRDRRMPWS